MSIHRSLQNELGISGDFDLAEALPIIERIAAALDYIHARGITHRDIKPSNILFDEEGAAYLADFGIAGFTIDSDEHTLTRLTQDGKTVGTPAYMSPEQISGRYEVAGQSDIYSLGTVLFEMLTGRVPYEADSMMQQAFKHVLEPVPSILKARPDLPAAMQHIIERAMAKDPADRYATASALAIDLKNVVAGETMVAKPVTATFDPPLPPPILATQQKNVDASNLADASLQIALVRRVIVGVAVVAVASLVAAGLFWRTTMSNATVTLAPNLVVTATLSAVPSSPPPATIEPTPSLAVTVAVVPPPLVTIEVAITSVSAATSLAQATPKSLRTPSHSEEQTYTVQPGDNLFRIGLRFGYTARELADYNGIPNMTLTYPGQVIRIPSDHRELQENRSTP